MIRNIVFDVGGVLVHLRYQPFIDYLDRAGVDMSNLPAWLARTGLTEHERGVISGDELLGRIAGMARDPLERDELRTQWLGMFERWDEMVALARGLMAGYRVYLLSNIGDLHWAHLDEQYGIGNLVHGAIASYRVGAVKPEPLIYRKAESQFGLDPGATVFIDDLAHNVTGARSCGWHAIHHQDARQTRDALRALGVRLPEPFAEED